jgi:hypothetical protein
VQGLIDAANGAIEQVTAEDGTNEPSENAQAAASSSSSSSAEDETTTTTSATVASRSLKRTIATSASDVRNLVARFKYKLRKQERDCEGVLYVHGYV